MENGFRNIADQILNDGLRIAQESPCTRRKYCAQIVIGQRKAWWGVNERFSNCCDGECIRETTQALHGQMIERGAESHAEMMTLLRFPFGTFGDQGLDFFLSGIESATGEELIGRDVLPCHGCALMIKAAKFKNVILRDSSRDIIYMPIDEIIEIRETEWTLK